MANPTGKGGHRFKKGQSGNPAGVSKAAKEIQKFKVTSYQDFINKLQEFGGLTPEEMKAVVQNPKTKMFDVIFGRILYDASIGKPDARQILLERLFGKVKDSGELNIKQISEISYSIKFGDAGEITAEKKELFAEETVIKTTTDLLK